MQAIKSTIHASLVATMLLTGCSKFLEKDSQDLSYVNNASQLEEVLVGEVYEKHPPATRNGDYFNVDGYYFTWGNIMDDDIQEYASGYSYYDTRKSNFGYFTWQNNPNVSREYAPTEDKMWPQMYKFINAANITIKQAAQMNDDTLTLHRVKGEAEFLRAAYYYQLVNYYAPAYNKQTAANDPGVPLKTTEYVEARFFTRSTVDSVYRQIVADLNAAENDLNNKPYKSYYHADINAVHLFQSRIYLYMQDYEKALAAADKVIASKPLLSSLTNHTPQTSFFTASSPENIFTMGGNAMPYIMMPDETMTLMPSDDLMSLYEEGDLRKSVFFTIDYQGKSRYAKIFWDYDHSNPEVFSENFFLRNVEAYLNKAEAAAMLDKEDIARQAINVVRKARIDQAHYQPATQSGAGLVSLIRDERRRELCFEGQRWFDLKRYAVNEKYPFSKEIVHTYSETSDSGEPPHIAATLKLEPGDPAYLIPIPAPAIIFNQGALKQNPARPDRSFN